MMAVSIAFGGASPDVKTPVPLFQTHLATGTNVLGNKPQYAVARDGRFLLNTAIERPSSPIVVAVNWMKIAGAIACSFAQSLPRAEMASRQVRVKPQVPPEIDEYRDERWRRESHRQIETAFDAERFIEQVGFAACLSDSRRPGPSLVRGGLRPARRRDAAQRAEGSRGVAHVGA